MANIVNSYTNTEELIKAFPVIHPTPVTTQMEKNIQNRLLTGFENWNRGTEAWMEWGNILYTPDSLYNVHGVHLTLKEYQMSSSLAFKSSQMMMGNFNNMLICGDWTAIRYDITSARRDTGEKIPGSVMEFVLFKDYGPDMGTRVVEGWAGTKGEDYQGLMHFLTNEEKTYQKSLEDAVLNWSIPETDDLARKYPVLHPTPNNSPWADEIYGTILRDFDNWNCGAEAWSTWADKYYAPGYTDHRDDVNLTLEELKNEAESDTVKVTRIYFDNMLISGEWAAIHYRTVRTSPDGGRTPQDVMQFLHFAKGEDGVRMVESWTK